MISILLVGLAVTVFAAPTVTIPQAEQQRASTLNFKAAKAWRVDLTNDMAIANVAVSNVTTITTAQVAIQKQQAVIVDLLNAVKVLMQAQQ